MNFELQCHNLEICDEHGDDYCHIYDNFKNMFRKTFI